MKGTNLVAFLMALLVGGTVFLGVRINSRMADLDRQMEDIWYRLDQLDDNVRNVQYRIQDTLEAQASLLSAQSWEYGEVDLNEKQVALSWSLSLKEYDPQLTQVALVWDGKEHPLTLEGTQYQGTFSLPLFAETQIEQLVVREGGQVRTQPVEEYFSPRYDCLPSVSMNFWGSGTGSAKGNGVYSQSFNGLISLSLSRPQETSCQIQQWEIVFSLDGEEIGRQQVDLSYTGQEGYLKAGASNGRQHSMPEPQAYADGEYSQLWYYLKDSWEIPYGSTLMIWGEARDSMGLIHRGPCQIVAVDGTGNAQWDGDTPPEAAIYDSQGELLWTADPELWQ